MVTKGVNAESAPTRRRATSAAAKEARRRQLLAAAVALFSERPYGDVTMAAVARRAGVAKGTTYLYFRTKEELFLALYRERLESWLDELRTELLACGGPVSPESFAATLRRTLEARPTLARLMALLHLVLEQNLELETAVDFKRWLGGQFHGLGGALESVLGEEAAGSSRRREDLLVPGNGARLLLRVNALVVGLHQMAHPVGAVAEALESDDLRPLRTEFGPELEQSVVCLLRGWPAP